MSSNRLFRNLLALCIGLMLGAIAAYSHAAAVPLMPGPGIAGTSTGFTTASSFTGQFSAAAFNSSFTTSVGGRAVTMPASMRMAANAGQFAAAAVRLNPAALVGGAVAAWLLAYGLEWINGQWVKSEDATVPSDGLCGMTAQQCAMTASASYGSLSPYWKSISGGSCYAGLRDYPNINVACTATGQPQKRPATDQDWAVPGASPLPDSAASELAPKGVPLPLDIPHILPHDIPLSDPYDDPVTGKRYRDQARITPSSNAKTADVQVTKVEVDEAGNPVKNPDGSEKAPEEQTDFCKKNPDASSCKPFDDVPDSELQKKENPFSLNPVSGFGADNASCPSPQQLFTKGGQAITWDWGQFCTFAQGIRPLIIGFAWLAAISMVIVVGRRG